jgi:16S rRNA (cytosine1402-N4)-methyltransferase
VHQSVLSQEAIELLRPQPGAVIVDCTLGSGGHGRSLLERVRPRGQLLGIDRDRSAIARASQWAAGYEPPPNLIQGNFAELARLVRDTGTSQVDGVLFDLGISSDQLDDPQRGFSFRQAGPLDMRMDRGSRLTAELLVNELPERELSNVIRQLGEERWAARIAHFIVRRRPLHTTVELAQAVEAAVPRAAWPPGIHPATRTFQALRIQVNDELSNLERGLRGALEILAPGGRLVVISFHSLEDRLVKQFLQRETKDCICPPQQPVCTCGHRATLRSLTKHPLRASAREVAINPRSRSARLRAAERLLSS